MQPSPSIENLAIAIRKIRNMQGLSQAQLAHLAGSTQQYISKVESGDADPTFSKIVAISQSLGFKLSEFMGIVDGSIEIISKIELHKK